MPTNKSSNKRARTSLDKGEKKKARPLALSAARRPATDSFLPSHILPLSSLFLSSRLLRFFPCACFGHRLRELRLFLPAPKSKLSFRTLPALLFFFGASCEFFPSCPCPEGRIVCGSRADDGSKFRIGRCPSDDGNRIASLDLDKHRSNGQGLVRSATRPLKRRNRRIQAFLVRAVRSAHAAKKCGVVFPVAPSPSPSRQTPKPSRIFATARSRGSLVLLGIVLSDLPKAPCLASMPCRFSLRKHFGRLRGDDARSPSGFTPLRRAHSSAIAADDELRR